jgi:hypothetical protein
MVYRWRCRHCDFSVWARTRGALSSRVSTHILGHNRDKVTEAEYHLEWNCPYCDQTGQSHDGGGLDSFGEHLFEHVDALIESGVHIADEFGRTGSVLVQTPLDSTSANDARLHFLSPCDIVVFVTANPGARIRLVQRDLSELPAWIVVLTTHENPLEGFSEEELSVLPLEIVQLDKQLGLAGLGETASRVLAEQENMEGKISVEFDILAELLDTFSLQEVFKFIHVLNFRLDDADALAHYYIPPSSEYEGSINVLSQVFDLQIRTEDGVFVSPANGTQQ